MQEGEKVREEEGRGGVRIRVSKSVPGYAPAAVSHALAGGVSGAAGTGKSKATRLRVTQSSSHFVTNRKHLTPFFFLSSFRPYHSYWTETVLLLLLFSLHMELCISAVKSPR